MNQKNIKKKKKKKKESLGIKRAKSSIILQNLRPKMQSRIQKTWSQIAIPPYQFQRQIPQNPKSHDPFPLFYDLFFLLNKL